MTKFAKLNFEQLLYFHLPRKFEKSILDGTKRLWKILKMGVTNVLYVPIQGLVQQGSGQSVAVPSHRDNLCMIRQLRVATTSLQSSYVIE